MKKLPGYLLIVTGVLLTGFSMLEFFNGNGGKENLFQVLILLFAGVVTLFSGIHLAVPPVITSPEKLKDVTDSYKK